MSKQITVAGNFDNGGDVTFEITSACLTCPAFLICHEDKKGAAIKSNGEKGMVDKNSFNIVVRILFELLINALVNYHIMADFMAAVLPELKSMRQELMRSFELNATVSRRQYRILKTL